VVGWYLEGLHWVMQYYYRGVPSWSWFYPFHYAPFLSDMTDLQSIECSFTLSEPVLPFQQVCSAAHVHAAPHMALYSPVHHGASAAQLLLHCGIGCGSRPQRCIASAGHSAWLGILRGCTLR
jgi:hypothetical protein